MAIWGSLAPDYPWVDEGGDPVQAAAEAAALRVRNAVRPPHGRQEGGITAGLEHLGEEVYNAAARPSRIINELVGVPPGALTSGLVPRVDQAVPEVAFDLMGLGSLGASPASAGIFGGKLAQTADKAKLARAESMAAQGATQDQIRDVTGWFQGVDGKWRFEIPDNAMRVKDFKENAPFGALSMHVEHPDLFKAYPDLADMAGIIDKRATAKDGAGFGSYSRPEKQAWPPVDRPETIRAYGKTPEEARSVALHELQHAVQQREGFARGGSPEGFKKDVADANNGIEFINDHLSNLSKQMDVARKAGDTAKLAELKDFYDKSMNYKLTDLVPKALADPMESYKRLAGEVEARNVQHRADWDAQKRFDVPVVYSQDVPNADQIVRFGSLAPQMSLPMDEASRLERALSQGFVPPVHGRPAPLFHETKAENIPGIEARGFDLSKVGARAGEDQLPDGVFLKREGRGIGIGRDSEVQMPLLTSARNIREFPDRDALARHLSKDDTYARHVSEGKLIDQEYKAKVEELEKVAWTRQKTPESEAAQAQLDDVLKEWGAKSDEVSAKARARSTELLKAEGLEGVRVWNDAGSFGRKVDTTVVFDPAKLRSPNAKFDPANAGKNMVLGANAGDKRTGAAAGFGSLAPREPIADQVKGFSDKWDKSGVRHFVAEQSAGAGGHLKLHDLVVPKENRGKGVGSQFMNELTQMADANGKTVVLTAAKDYGATSVSRLKEFYKQFGFVENKGRNKDFRISDNMYRRPKSDQTLGANAGDRRIGAAVLGAEQAQPLSMAPTGIRAYHGSPHDFDKFDMSRIGTGEGAQSYGHGLYFAENEGVARSYKNDPRMLATRHGADWDNVKANAGTRFYDAKGDADEAIYQLRDRIRNSVAYGDTPASLKELRDSLELLRSGWRPPTGKMYEVNINAKPEQFLDWDKSLAKQPANIVDPLVDLARKHNLMDPRERGSMQSVMYDLGHGKVTGSPANATAAMREAGIPGIKYLDQGSRHFGIKNGMIGQYGSREKALEVAQERLTAANNTFGKQAAFDRKSWQDVVDALSKSETSNYVLFDDALVNILRKYAMPGAVGAGGFGSLAPQEPQ